MFVTWHTIGWLTAGLVRRCHRLVWYRRVLDKNAAGKCPGRVFFGLVYFDAQIAWNLQLKGQRGFPTGFVFNLSYRAVSISILDSAVDLLSS